jgi:hypothetical protein
MFTPLGSPSLEVFALDPERMKKKAVLNLQLGIEDHEPRTAERALRGTTPQVLKRRPEGFVAFL